LRLLKSKCTGRANDSIVLYVVDLYIFCVLGMSGVVVNATVIFLGVVMNGTKQTFHRYSLHTYRIPV
jgi:hypothetical protein